MQTDVNFLKIVDSILKNEEYKKIGNIKHHHNTRLDHCMKVSYYSYKLAKAFNLDEQATAKAGLLHDFYLETIKDQDTVKDKLKLFSINHPQEAVNNSKRYFGLNEKEENIIASHMFPLSNKMPKYKESWIVTTVDKGLALTEFVRYFNYKFGLYVIFIINVLKIKSI